MKLRRGKKAVELSFKIPSKQKVWGSCDIVDWYTMQPVVDGDLRNMTNVLNETTIQEVAHG